MRLSLPDLTLRVAVAAVDLLALVLLIAFPPLGTWTGLCLHASLAIGLALFGPQAKDPGAHAVLGWGVAWVPVLGPLICMPHAGRREGDDAERTRFFHAEWVQPVPEVPERRFLEGHAERDLQHLTTTAPLESVLRHGSDEDKIAAIRRIAHGAAPVSIGMLRTCLSDPNPEIQLYAQGELARREAALTEQVREAEALVADAVDPDSSSMARARLQDAREALVQSGVLDAPTARWMAAQDNGAPREPTRDPVAPVAVDETLCPEDALARSERQARDAWRRRDRRALDAVMAAWPEGVAERPAWLVAATGSARP